MFRLNLEIFREIINTKGTSVDVVTYRSQRVSMDRMPLRNMWYVHKDCIIQCMFYTKSIIRKQNLICIL